MVCVQGPHHMAPVLLPVVQMKTAMGHRSVAVMAAVHGVWNQVRINETLASFCIHVVILWLMYMQVGMSSAGFGH